MSILSSKKPFLVEQRFSRIKISIRSKYSVVRNALKNRASYSILVELHNLLHAYEIKTILQPNTEQAPLQIHIFIPTIQWYYFI